MTPERVIDLLKRTDAAIVAPRVAVDLQRIVGPHPFVPPMRMRFALTASVAGAAAALALAIVWPYERRALTAPSAGTQPGGATVAVADDGEIHAKLQRLDSEIRVRLAVARRLAPASAGTISVGIARIGQIAGDPVAEARRQADAAACFVLLQGEELETEHALPAAAARAYDEVIDAFPRTHWAERARQRLQAIKSSSGGTS